MLTEIFEALIQHYDGEMDYVMDTMRDLYDNVKRNPKTFLFSLRSFIQDVSEELNICPDCGNKLTEIESREIHTELDCYRDEIFYSLICEECGWKSE